MSKHLVADKAPEGHNGNASGTERHSRQNAQRQEKPALAGPEWEGEPLKPAAMYRSSGRLRTAVV